MKKLYLLSRKGKTIMDDCVGVVIIASTQEEAIDICVQKKLIPKKNIIIEKIGTSISNSNYDDDPIILESYFY